MIKANLLKMSFLNIPSSSHKKFFSHSSQQTHYFDLDENFTNNSVRMKIRKKKKIKLDTSEDRKKALNALNARPSFANLVSSASLV